jgi:folate-dependent phosphoribosylglycinamide formyltransferase PurN
VIQHEVDHLDGVLMIDRTERDQRRALKALREGGTYAPEATRMTRSPSPGQPAVQRGLKTAYLGTSEFAATVLRRLADSRHTPVLVVTPPDSRQGRGRRLAPPAAAEAAGQLGLRLHQTPDVNSPESLDAIRAAQPQAIAVCAFGHLIKEPLLSEWTMLNVHPSLVPRWRGAAPIERTLMAGDTTTGVTIMRLTAGLDSGPIGLIEEFSIAPDDDYESLSAKLADVGGELLVRALDDLQAGKLEFRGDDAVHTPRSRRTNATCSRRGRRPSRADRAGIARAWRTWSSRGRAARRAEAGGQHSPPRGDRGAGGRLVLGSSDGGLSLESSSRLEKAVERG